MFHKPKKLKKPTPVKAQIAHNEDFETAEELFPEIYFPPEPVREFVPDLPWRYSDDRMVIMARDPETIYAYWDISEEKRRSLELQYGDRWHHSYPVLRVYELTDTAALESALNSYDVTIDEYAGSWYLHTGTPDRFFCVDFGRILNDGTFITIVRSNFAKTPRNSISDRVDPDWMLVSENERKLYRRISQGDGMSSINLFEHDLK